MKPRLQSGKFIHRGINLLILLDISPDTTRALLKF
jgi:hypothetical protein